MFEPSIDLRTFASRYGHLLRKIERAATGHGIGTTEGRILTQLWMCQSTRSDLSRLLCMDSGQVTRVTCGLLRKRLIENKQKLKGRFTLGLTNEGADRAHRLISAQGQSAHNALSEMSDQEKQLFYFSVAQLSENLFDDSDPSAHHIRKSEPGDTGLLILRAVESFCGTAFNAYDERLIGHIHGLFAELAARPHILLMAMRGRIAAGAIAASVGKRSSEGRIHFLVMFQDDQGKGTGAKLLDEAMTQLRELGVKSVTTELPASDFGKSYYEKQPGWTRFEVEGREFCGRQIKWERWKCAL